MFSVSLSEDNWNLFMRLMGLRANYKMQRGQYLGRGYCAFYISQPWTPPKQTSPLYSIV